MSVARIPGNTSIVLMSDETVLPEEEKESLSRFMTENIRFVYNSEDKRELISRVIGGELDRNQINIEEKIGIAYISMGDEKNNINNSLRLAQQLSSLQIVNQ